MGYRKDQGESQNKPSEEALETNENKGIEKEGRGTVHEPQDKQEVEEEAVGESPEGEEAEEPITVEESIEETAEAVGEAEEEEEVIEAPEEPEEEEVEEVERRREEEVEEEIVEERIYTIPLSRAWISPRKKRAPKAIRMVRSFIQRHMKPEAIVVSNDVNERLWRRGIEKPPRRIRVRASKDKDGKVTLRLAEGD